MNRVCLAITLSIASLGLAAQASQIVQAQQTVPEEKSIFKVKLADGSYVFTDKPQAQAEQITFANQTQNLVPAANLTSSPKPLSSSAPPSTATYSVKLLSPADEETIRNNAGNITIEATQPSKPYAPRYHLLLDGKEKATNTSGKFALKGVDRGAHQFQVILIGNKGKTLASSEVRTLYLHQASVLINNN